MKQLLTLLLFFCASSYACEEMPNPYIQLSMMDKQFKGFANIKDFKALYQTAEGFQNYDYDKNGKITVEEIHRNHVEYQKECEAIQNQPISK